jgi:L-ascorbate metabolism protein UlaG (beta-lactamase superfamily)
VAAADRNHFDGRRFYNPSPPSIQPFSALPRLAVEPRSRWPAFIDVPQVQPPTLAGAAVVVTFIGHSTFLIRTAAATVLTDPVYSKCAGPWGRLGPRRVRPPAVRFDDLPHIDVVLLSHNHYDHCDTRTLARLARRFDPVVVTPLGNGRLVRSAGMRRVEELDWWQSATASSLAVTLTPAHHFSARTPFDRNRALWGGFVVDADRRRLYFAGDTAYVQIFAEIRHRLGPIDLALLPIGAYEPRWFMRAVHMNPEEAVQAHLDLDAGQSIGMHFGTFQLTTEGIDEPIRALERAREVRGLSASGFRTLGFGDSVRVS